MNKYINATFENTKVQIPNGYNAYLTNLYHDYMQLPPEEERIPLHIQDGFILPEDKPNVQTPES